MILDRPIERLKFLNDVSDTNLLGGGKVYENASISLEEFHPVELYPTALYVIKDNLRKIQEIREELLQKGIDIFRLTGVVEHSEGVIAPPVIELSDGVPAIVDGIHRVYLAMIMGKYINCIYIKGASAPIISIPVEWEQVVEYDVKPDRPEQLRIIRDGIADESNDLRRYYRDLSYLGSKGRRPRSNQEA